jgi:hypothetical protein
MNRFDAMRELIGVAHGQLDALAIQQKLTGDPDTQASLHEDWSRLRDAIDVIATDRDPRKLANYVASCTASGEFARAVVLIRNRLECRNLSGEVDTEESDRIVSFLTSIAEEDARYLEFVKDLDNDN